MKILLVTPPMQDTGSPYPATAYLTGFLRSRGHDVTQDDFAIRVVSRLLSRAGVRGIVDDIRGGTLALPRGLESLPQESPAYAHLEYFLAHHERYEAVIEQVVEYLRGNDPVLKHRIIRRNFLPESPLFTRKMQQIEDSDRGVPPDTRVVASRCANLLLRELYTIMTYADPAFGVDRYMEQLGDAPDFTPLERRLVKQMYFDRIVVDITRERMAVHQPDLLGISVPFHGQIYGALRIAKVVKAAYPKLPIVIGGGFCNTSMRDLSDARLFKYVDYVTLDDGERPLECLIEHLEGKRPVEKLHRTFTLVDGAVRYLTAGEKDVPHAETGTPTYDGLPLQLYIPGGPSRGPEIHEMWWYRWNKLTLAHGCYWKKCAFCDIHLDYIGRYDRAPAKLMVDRMQAMSTETGWSGFHFTDEACPPSQLRALSHELRERNLHYVWWGNVRFDKAFTPDLAAEMADAGCIAVTGGLEIASDRLLALMEKGTTVEQVARVCRAFKDAKISVHAYLMYGFPTETDQEIMDSLEVVRQFFANGLLNTATWHRFITTSHSPIGRNPERYGITLKRREPGKHGVFSSYVIPHETDVPNRYNEFGPWLAKAVRQYEEGNGLDADVTSWFQTPVPKTTLPPDLVAGFLRSPVPAPNRLRLPQVVAS